MAISLTLEQQAWIAARIERGEFASEDEAARQLIDERIAEHTIEDDDLAWAKPYVDYARADIAKGRTHTRQEYEACMNRLLASMKV